VSVDRIVSTDTIRRNNHLTKLPSAMVDAVVEAPWGAHPSASPSLYRADERHLKEYVKASASEEAFAAYLSKYVHGAAAQAAYLDLLGGGRLAGLQVSESTLS
ncbi:MAG: glutaconate CoA-transferase, partial [Ramlibacter sp.]